MTAVGEHWTAIPSESLRLVGTHGAGFAPSVSRSASPGRQQSHTPLLGETAVLEMIARGSSLPEIHRALCRLTESTVAAGSRCGIYLIDWTGPRFRTSAAPGVSAAFNEVICRPASWSEASPCARAVRFNVPVLWEGVESEALWQKSVFALQARLEEWSCCWAVPISSLAGRVLGVVVVLGPPFAARSAREEALIARVACLAGIAIERAQRDGALKRSEAFLTEAQRLSATGSFSWNVATNEFTWSDQLYRIFDFPQGSPVTPESLRSRVHPEDWPSLARILHQAREGIAEIEYEHRLLMPDRAQRYLHLVARGTLDEHGQLEYIGAIQDVTNRRVAEEALGRARTELWHVARIVSLGALSASIAHEVNQPLSGIITNASTCLKMLAADPPNVAGALETARRTLRDGSRAADVIARLRMLFGKKETKTELVDLNEAAREVVALSQSELQESGVSLRLELSDATPCVLGDRVQLQQVILNLLLNASDAMAGVEGRPKQLTIGTHVDEQERVCLRVADTGIGLEAHLASRLAEPFYTTKGNGMGIGLFVSRSIVESHQGCLCFSPNEGPGATFSFAIPRARQLPATETMGHCPRDGRLGSPPSTASVLTSL